MESLVVQLNIVNGSSTEEGPFTRLHTFRDDKGSGHLMLVVDATGPDPQEVCTWAANELVEEFAQSALSLTGRLQEAMRRVHAALQEENRTSLAEHRHTLSVACGYVRGEDLYFTDTGNMSAFAIGPDSLHQLSPPSDEAQPPLGSLQRTQLRVRHHQLEPGDSILFAGPALSRPRQRRGRTERVSAPHQCRDDLRLPKHAGGTGFRRPGALPERQPRSRRGNTPRDSHRRRSFLQLSTARSREQCPRQPAAHLTRRYPDRPHFPRRPESFHRPAAAATEQPEVPKKNPALRMGRRGPAVHPGRSLLRRPDVGA